MKSGLAGLVYVLGNLAPLFLMCDTGDLGTHIEPVENKTFELGILVCGSANGVAITANKHQGIRAAICWNEELASLARKHNNANILCLPARFIDFGLAEKVVEKFINTDFEGGRHATRVNKITC